MKQKTKNYPFFPDKTKANIDQFTDNQNENKKKGFKQNEKLMLNSTDKKPYVIDGEMVEWYLSKSLRLEDVTIKQKIEYSKSERLKLILSLILRNGKKIKLGG